MPYDDFENTLRCMVNNEFTERSSNLREEIEKEWSRLAAKQLLSGSVGVTKTTELCINDLTGRIQFIFEKIKVVVDSKSYSYSKELHNKAKDLFVELSETAKDTCFVICREKVDMINTGSVKDSIRKIDLKFQYKQKDILNEIGIYFDKLKNKPKFTTWTWIKQSTNRLIWIIITAIISTIVGILIGKYM